MPAPPPRRIVQALLGTPKGGRLPAGLLGSQGALSKYTPTMREKIAGLLAKNWYGDTREGYQNAERLVNVGETVVPPLGLLSGSYDAGRALGGGNMMQAGLLGGLAALPLPGALKKKGIDFDDWFSGSKVVDSTGKPMPMYHGTKSAFDEFNLDNFGATDDGLAGKAIYHTYNPEEASGYAVSDIFGKGDAPNVRPSHVSIKNPLIISNGTLPDGRKIQGSVTENGKIIRKLADEGGYDGVIWTDRSGNVRHSAVFDPSQVRSTFDRGKK